MGRHYAAACPLILAACLTASAQGKYTIWFDRPCSLEGKSIWLKSVQAGGPASAANRDPEWENCSLPIGNGSIGANVMGSVSEERLTLNEKTLWRGGPGTSGGALHYWDVNKNSAGALDRIRGAFSGGNRGLAERLTAESMNGKAGYEAGSETPFRFGGYTTLGELSVETGIGGCSGYRRELSVDSAVARVSFASQGVSYSRTFFVSYPDNVMVIRFKSDRRNMQNLRIIYRPTTIMRGSPAPDGAGGMAFRGRLADNNMEFCVRIRAIAKGGSVRYEEGAVAVNGADEATILFTADTDYKPNFDPDPSDPKAYVGVKPEETTRRWISAAGKRGFASLLKRHVSDYRALFGRVELDLGGGARPASPTWKRLADYRGGAPDRGLEELYFQFGRYLLIASSRPGQMPANLQGMWQNDIDAPWHADYHNNINLEMNYWPALAANLAECALPLALFVKTLEKPGERTAGSYFGKGGWTTSVSSNIFGFTAPLSSTDMSWNLSFTSGPWLAVHLWDYYDYTRDIGFLKEHYRLIKGSADFAAGYLWKFNGFLTCAPSTSPEHGPVSEGATFANAVAREILICAQKASSALERDPQERAAWSVKERGILPYRIGRYGQLMEWYDDIDDPDDRHRHVNHLFGLFPGSTISLSGTPELAAAARVALQHRGDGATGWSMGWKLNLWARLHDGGHAYRLFSNLLKNGTLDNLWDNHPPFQIDGNFGGTAGMAGMLLQSRDSDIILLPALPAEWRDGSVKGLCARGNFEAGIRWSGGQLTEAVVKSKSGGTCRVVYGGRQVTLRTKRGRSYVIRPVKDGLAAVR